MKTLALLLLTMISTSAFSQTLNECSHRNDCVNRPGEVMPGYPVCDISARCPTLDLSTRANLEVRILAYNGQFAVVSAEGNAYVVPGAGIIVDCPRGRVRLDVAFPFACPR